MRDFHKMVSVSVCASIAHESAQEVDIAKRSS